MNRGFSIRPSKDLRNNYAQVSALTRVNPVAITVNGREDTVLLSHEDYIEQQQYITELEARIKFYNHLARGEEDFRLGRVVSEEEAFDEIIKELEALDV